jgi:hypothetical protein
VILPDSDKAKILSSFPGHETPGVKMLNIARIYDQKYNNLLSKMYGRVDVTELEGLDEPEDICGYLGQQKWYRAPKQETAISD